GPRLGKYRVNLRDLEEVGVRAIEEAVAEADVVVIDEVGPMELFSERFVEAVRKALRSGKPVVGTIHARARGPLLDEIRHGGAEIMVVSFSNRDRLHEAVLDKLRPLLRRR
ncbi:NTPase, partial [Candidatus Bathyarchaeota archaeon]